MGSSGYPFITPSSTCLSEDLLFFDTFSHSGSEKANFDLVQFPSPVIIDLIKIVPLGQPIKAEIPGNVRLGATNPSNCELEFFINDLTKQDAHTMTDLGKFYCSEKDTDFTPPLQIQTDGLLLRGSYRTLTLAIFGQIAAYDEKIEDDPTILSATSPPAQTPASPVASERDIPYIVRSVDQELLRRARDDSESFESTNKSNEISKKRNIIDDEGLDDDPTEDQDDSEPIKDRLTVEEMSSSERGQFESHNSVDKKKDDILEFLNDVDRDVHFKRSNKDEYDKRLSKPSDSSFNDSVQICEEYRDQESPQWTFNIKTYRPKPLIYFVDPSLTLQERSLSAQKSKSTFTNYRDAIEKEIEKVKEMFDVFDNPNFTKTDEWVTLIEDLTNDIANMSLSRIVNDDEMLSFLIKQIIHGLDMNSALKQRQTGFKVRHLRAGIKLATILFHCGESAVSTLLEAAIPHKILSLYFEDQMSLPLKLLIIKCLNAICDTVEGVECVISRKYDWKSSNTLVDGVVKRIAEIEKNKGKPSDHDGPLAKFESVSSAQHKIDDETSTTKQFPLLPEPFSDDLKHDSDTEQLKHPPDSYTCYQMMVLILLAQPTTRVTISIGSLIKKVRLYQNISKLASICARESDDSEDSLVDSEKFTQRGVNSKETVRFLQGIVNLMKDSALSIAQPIRYLPAKVQFQVKPNPSDTHLAIYKWLKHFNILDHLNSMLDTVQSESFDYTTDSEMDQSIKVQSLCLLLIQQLLDSPRGTQFFLTVDCCDSTHNLIRSLADKTVPKHSPHRRMTDGIENCMDAPFARNESLTISSCHDTSLKMSYNFKVFSCIDKLFHFHRELINKRGEPASYEPEKILHQLYIISEHPYGLQAIVKHFACIGNLDCLLRFLDMPEYHKQLEFVKETSIDYALELIGSFFRLNDNVLEIADEYLDTLMNLCKSKDKALSIRVKSLLPWLSPFDTDQPLPLITYSEDTFRQLARVIRKSIPNYSIPFAKGLDFELPPQMITAVRILRQLCIPPQVESFIKTNLDLSALQRLAEDNGRSTQFMVFVDSLPRQQNHNQSWNLNLQMSRNIGISCLRDDSITEQLNQISNTFKLFQPYDESVCGELKYHYGMMLVFEHEGLKRLLNTLRELTGNYPRPVYQSAALSGFRGRIVLSYIHCVIIILHSMVCHLIDARGSEFKDTSIIPVVLETYSLLCFVPKPCEAQKNKEARNELNLTKLQKSIDLKLINYQLAQQTKRLILSILMSYTQMCLSVSESEEKVISKSMWTKMLKEVIEFTLSTPVFFHHGLDILTKILPSPLPCSSVLDSIDQEQLFKNVNRRKLWSAHLHPLHIQIEQMISHLSICYQSNIRTLLCYLCNQLCDLSSNAANMVAKIITDTLVSCAAKLALDTNGNISPDNNIQKQQQAEDKSNAKVLSGTQESAYAVKMIINLLSNLITDQAFETAFTNHLQILSKKDEKLLANLQITLKFNDDHRLGDSSDEPPNTAGPNNSPASVSAFIESIKLLNSNSSKDGYSIIDVSPPDELTKINLLDVARRTSDRISLTSSLKRTYRLKVLMDLNSCAHRAQEPPASSSASKRLNHNPYSSYQEISVPSSHKSYVAPLRGRGRTSTRLDSFRSRPQNTSRPPSIHVDDFNDLYGENPAQSVAARYPSGVVSKSSCDYRGSNQARAYPPEVSPLAVPPQVSSQSEMGPSSHRHVFFSPQPPPTSQSANPGSSFRSRRSRSRSKAKLMRMLK